MSTPGFDQFADSYDDDLQRALSASGEDKYYFAKLRISWTMAKMTAGGHAPNSVLDFGCGTGTAVPFLHEVGIANYVGVDPSKKSIDVAKRTYPQDRFCALNEYMPEGLLDFAYTNGVFHHIPVPERLSAARYVWESLRPGGYFAFWENNPWNPGTRYVMSNCAFDRDALTLTPRESRRLLESAGFSVIRSDFLFIFPRGLRWFRRFEPLLSSLPLGGQYLVLCRRLP